MILILQLPVYRKGKAFGPHERTLLEAAYSITLARENEITHSSWFRHCDGMPWQTVWFQCIRRRRSSAPGSPPGMMRSIKSV